MNKGKTNKEIYLDYFKGREDCFACQGKDYYYPVQKTLTVDLLTKHFNDLATFGVYVLTSNNKCNFICIDIDIPKNELSVVDFKNSEKKFNYLYPKLQKLWDIFHEKLEISQNSILLEDTGGRGYHIWLFLKSPINARIVVQFSQIIKKLSEFNFEFFPKQDSLNEKRRFGNLIKLPLGIHQKYELRSCFFTLKDAKADFILPLEDNLNHLSAIKRISESDIQKIIHQHKDKLEKEGFRRISVEKDLLAKRSLYKKDLAFLFKNCKALNRLQCKADKGIKLSYIESFHFANSLLSVEDSRDFIVGKIKSSYSSQFNLDLTKRELDMIEPFYPASCKKLIEQEICDGFCNLEIERRSSDPLLSDPTPISYWLTYQPKKINYEGGNLVRQIADIDNIKKAYWKIKKYQKEEDVVFYDDFDFSYFEKNLEINSRYISRHFEKKEEISFIGYININMPKKLDSGNNMLYRPLVYSSIFDQIVIQSIFNVVSNELESKFHNCSWGYRCEIGILNSDNIFYDWRKYYPRFRSEVLTYLRKENIKYYICCDIAGFYDNIRHSILLEQLRGCVDDNYIFNTIKKLVEIYKFDDEDKGIPQGPAYARILANLYLNDFDREIIENSSGYLRYVDDFFLFYESKEAAESGLKKVFELLNDLGLTLSDDENKKPEILCDSKEERVVSKLDDIQYGIFDEFKFIGRLDIEQVNNFYDAVERHKLTPATLGDVIEINSKLPSLIYLLSKDWIDYHAIKVKLPKIIKYLVDEKLFYPKRLKYIFYKIIDLMLEYKYDICDLYFKLDGTYKIYFLLSLHKMYKTNNELRDVLVNIIKHSVQDSNQFVKGFAIVIDKDIGADKFLIDEKHIEDIFNSNSYFLKLKFLLVSDYFKLPQEQKELLRNKILPQSLFIEKKYFLSNIRPITLELTDTLHVKNLLQYNDYFLLIECCGLFVEIVDHNSLFNELIRYISSKVKYKDIARIYLTNLVFEKYKSSGIASLENMINLCDQITDSEIKREMNNVIKRIQQSSASSDNDFIKSHDCLDKYNGCFYYKAIDCSVDYDYIELIPYPKLFQYDYADFDVLKNNLLDLAYEKVLPDLKFEVDSSLEQIAIKYSLKSNIVTLGEVIKTLCLRPKDVLKGFRLSVDIYKKANYFFKLFKKIPKISIDNLLIDDKDNIFFKNLGVIFTPRYIISNENIVTNEKKDIPKMIAILLKEIFFQNDTNKVHSFQEKDKIGSELFLAHFIIRLGHKDLSLRYSYNRLYYLINKIESLGSNSNYETTVLYFKERLKALLFENTKSDVNWFDICKSLNTLYGEFAIAYPLVPFDKVDFRNKTFLNFSNPRGLHYLSSSILNICLNIDNLLKEKIDSDNLINLFDICNYFSIFCIELISFIKSTLNKEHSHITDLNITVNAILTIKNYNQNINEEDISSILTLRKKVFHNQDLFDSSVQFTLKQICLFYLLNNTDCKTEGNKIIINKNSADKLKEFEMLVHNLIFRALQIEKSICGIIENLNNALRTNQDFSTGSNNIEIKREIITFCKEINSLRITKGVRRYSGKRIALEKWPIEGAYCKSWRGVIKGNKKHFNKIPLSNLFPSTKSKCSWDMYRNELRNLVIPNDRINELIKNLTGGKFLRYKLGYLYSEKAKAIWDVILLIISGALFIFTFHIVNNDSNSMMLRAFFGLVDLVSGVIFLFFITKLLKKDFQFWVPQFNKLFKHIKD